MFLCRIFCNNVHNFRRGFRNPMGLIGTYKRNITQNLLVYCLPAGQVVCHLYLRKILILQAFRQRFPALMFYLENT